MGVEEHGQARRRLDGIGPSDQRRYGRQGVGYSPAQSQDCEGSRHPDRNVQFEHINSQVLAAQARGQPVISV
ncbi:MAG: hypothetical protein E5X37_34210, partial [Mesorhizobium sp.]